MVISRARPCGWEMVWLDRLNKWILHYLQKLGGKNCFWYDHQPVVVVNFITFCTSTKVLTAAPPLLKVFISVKNWNCFRCQTFHHGCYIAKLQFFGNHSCWKNSQLLPWVFVLKKYQDFLHHACSLSAPFPSSHTSSYDGIVNAHTTHAPCPPPFRNHTPHQIRG